MGRFNTFEIKEKTVKIGSEEFVIKTLTGKDSSTMMNAKKEDNPLLLMALASLKQTDSTITLKDLEELPLVTLTDLINAVSEVNEG